MLGDDIDRAVVLNELDCSGEESRLQDCSRQSVIDPQCNDHTLDVGARCGESNGHVQWNL